MEPPTSLDGCVHYEHGSEGDELYVCFVFLQSSRSSDSIDIDRVYVVPSLPNFQVPALLFLSFFSGVLFARVVFCSGASFPSLPLRP